MSHNENMLYWVQCGQQTLNIRRHEVLMVSFGLPAMTDEEFFGEQLINNLAQFLSVPASKVGIAGVCLPSCCHSSASFFMGLTCLFGQPAVG